MRRTLRYAQYTSLDKGMGIMRPWTACGTQRGQVMLTPEGEKEKQP